MKTLTLKCKTMDADRNGADWAEPMRVTVEASDDPTVEEVAKLVDQATYELLTESDEESRAQLVRAAGSPEHGICWLEEDGCGVVIEWHEA